jgi:hypothetical protein
MPSRGSVWAAGIVGFLIGIGVATLWSKSAADGPSGDSSPHPSDAHEPAAQGLSRASSDAQGSSVSSSARAPVEVPAPSSAPSPRSTLVYGRILESNGAPFRHAKAAWISFVNRAGQRWNAEASEGAYAIANLPLDSYFVTARVTSHRDADDRLELTASQPEVRKDLVVRQATILRVFVRTPDGEPFLEALKKAEGLHQDAHDLVPVATVGPPGAHVYEVIGSLNNPFGVGQYWYEGPEGEEPPAGCMGYLTLARDPPVSVSLVFCHAVLQTTRVEPGTEDVSFVLTIDELRAAQSSFRVQVVDAATSGPIDGAFVQLDGGTIGIGTMHTNAAGVLSVDPELPGRFDLLISKEGYEEVRQVVDLEAGQPTDLGIVALNREAVAELRFVDGLGRPTQAVVYLCPLAPGSTLTDIEHARGLRSDPAGVLKIRGLARKVYVLRTGNYDAAYAKSTPETTWVSGSVTIDATSGSVPPTTIQLVPGVPLAIRVEGRSAVGLRFAVIDGQGRAILRDRFWDNAPRPLRLPAGSYRVQLCDAGDAVLAERSVTLAGEPVELALAP